MQEVLRKAVARKVLMNYWVSGFELRPVSLDVACNGRDLWTSTLWARLAISIHCVKGKRTNINTLCAKC
jgi:hypothetical protein